MKTRNFVFNFMFNLIAIASLLTNTVYAVDMGAITAPLTEITQVLLIIAGGACVGKIIHIGILYVMSSAADKSTAKTALLPWIVGTCLCFGAAAIGPSIIGIFQTDKNVLEY